MVGETELWEELKNHPDFEICSTYPHQIRKKATGRILKERLHDVGYIRVWLDGKLYYKHRLIAIQWIPNDDPALKGEVDHINRIKTDNHISNLRWCTHSENLTNRSMKHTTFVDELPEFAIAVEHYGKHNDIQDLYYCDDVFYVYDRNHNNQYRVINKHQDCQGRDYIEIRFPDELRLKLFYNKFKQEYDLD